MTAAFRVAGLHHPLRRAERAASTSQVSQVDVSTAYNQWTQFESFPKFMEGVEGIRQIDDTHTHWITSVAGVSREFDATITEQMPDERVAWRSDNGPDHAGVVTFHRLDGTTTRVTAQMDIDLEGFVENAADTLGILASHYPCQGALSRPDR